MYFVRFVMIMIVTVVMLTTLDMFALQYNRAHQKEYDGMVSILGFVKHN